MVLKCMIFFYFDLTVQSIWISLKPMGSVTYKGGCGMLGDMQYKLIGLVNSTHSNQRIFACRGSFGGS